MMRAYLSFFPLVFLAGFCANGQLPAAGATGAPPRHSVSIDVKVAVAGGGGNNAQGSKDEHGRFTGAGGVRLNTTTMESKTSQRHRIALEIAVRNFSNQADNVKLEWYFFGEPVGSSKVFLFDSATKDIALEAGGTENINAVSKESETSTIQQTTTASGYVPIMTKKETGVKLKGWLVRIVADGKVIQARGSDMKFEEAGKDDAKLDALKQSQNPRRR